MCQHHVNHLVGNLRCVVDHSKVYRTPVHYTPVTVLERQWDEVMGSDKKRKKKTNVRLFKSDNSTHPSIISFNCMYLFSTLHINERITHTQTQAISIPLDRGICTEEEENMKRRGAIFWSLCTTTIIYTHLRTSQLQLYHSIQLHLHWLHWRYLARSE